ncbi:uncharacterized protein LY89DRAFT_732116 [Mollisia scopiformis]|uniref:Heterokaryon incompatibility domain-containing protein n=1 Tax=Mollisia scopiformis TaxID=149040 RepID=A0A194XEI6_MOLSC|nr:uncharacterized protein LY89DRAFT_732116 [Mollisia scopiformis]KUJ18559.1 hypothetical protein LY89DRAFT_732116 [Mollisia scopiformis]
MGFTCGLAQRFLRKREPHKYAPLDEVAHEIRLVTLHPARRFKDPVRISLSIAPFTSGRVPQFEALSYAWGAHEHTSTIFVGEKGFETLSVTENLGIALPYLRYKDKPRVLWIDAICVNQRDPEERSKQVKRMADIYSSAARVIAWLGPSSETTATAIGCFRTIAAHVVAHWAKWEMQPLSADGSWADAKVPPPFSRAACLAMLEFISHDWFERLWIYQEIRLASQDSILLCGHQVAEWSHFRTAIFFLDQKKHLLDCPEDVFGELKNRIDMTWRICRYGGYIPLEELLELTNMSKCSDPRDRVFALISLLDEDSRECGIEADYSKTTQEVYKDVVKKIVTGNFDLRLLSSYEMDEFEEQTPSWIPDWSVPKITQLLPEFSAAGWSECVVDFEEEDIMKVQGKMVDSLLWVEKFELGSGASDMRIYRELLRVLSRLGLENLETSHIGVRSLAKILCANNFPERFIPGIANLRSIRHVERELALVLNEPPEAWEERSLELWGELLNFCKGRSMFKTKNGYVGLAPRATRVGDLVTVLLGSPTPTILRPAPDRGFRFIGEAYCGGLMHGEAFVGPLPTPFEAILAWHEEDTCYRDGFLNTETGAFQIADPRMGNIPLPPGWKIREHRKKDWRQLFFNETTQEDNGHFDPRLTPKSLKERGVDIQTFDLV